MTHEHAIITKRAADLLAGHHCHCALGLVSVALGWSRRIPPLLVLRAASQRRLRGMGNYRVALFRSPMVSRCRARRVDRMAFQSNHPC